MNQKACPVINELWKRAMVDLTKRKPWEVWKKLPDMYQLGKLWRKSGDDRKAFILLSRWIYIVEWIKKTTEYKENTTQYVGYMSISQIDEVRSTLKELATLLTARYNIVVTNATLENDTSTIGWLKYPEMPFDEISDTEPEDFISCIQLFEQMQRNNRYLIIDIRTKEDYVTSRIKSEGCINIPENEIHAGKIGGNLGKFLLEENEDMYTLLQRRSSQYIDMIILLDWRSTQHTLIEGSELHVLREILRRWDFNTKGVRIVILDGGFTEWLKRYPAYATNPNVMDPNSQTNAMDEMFEKVQVPVWLNSDDERSPFNRLSLEEFPIKKSNQNNMDMVDSYADKDLLQKNQETSIDLIATPDNKKKRLNDSTNENDLQDSVRNPYQSSNKRKSKLRRLSRKLENRVTEKKHDDEDFILSPTTPKKSIVLDVAPKSNVDRSCKPSNLSKQYSDCAALLRLMNQLHELLKNEAQFEYRILHIERERSYESFNKNRDFNNRSEAEFTLLEAKLEELKNKKSKIRIALAKQKFEDLVMNKEDTKEKMRIEISIGSMEQRLKTISIDRKKLREKIAAKEEKRVVTKQTRNDNSTHNELLSPERSPKNVGLKRSHSSPSLSQVKKLRTRGQIDGQKALLVDVSRSGQSEIHTSNSTRPNINTRYSLLTWSDGEERMEPIFCDSYPGITGLKNLGNSCYMNSIIQCLSNTAYLTRYFTDNVYLDDLNTSKDNGTHGHVAEEVAQVIKALWRGQYKSISPRDLKGVIGQYKLQFDTYEQQDSHEFLTFLLDWVHNDLKKGVKIRVDGPLSSAEKEWDKAMESQESIISHLFFGQLKSIIRCTTCGNNSTTYETFNSLTMSLPHSNRCTLDDCVKKYVSGQTVSGWKCPNCKLQRDAVKKFDFVKLAPIIVIHLNRFAKSEGCLEKNNTSVEFPLTDFNLKPYLVPDTESANTVNQSQNYNYSLYAVSNHYGTMHAGHYTAFCKSATQNKWYKYDDRTVNEVSPSQVKCQNTNAYLLFYTSFPYEPYTFT